MFNESTSKACNFNHTNVILDYDESEDLKILSQHPKHTKGFFDFCVRFSTFTLFRILNDN